MLVATDSTKNNSKCSRIDYTRRLNTLRTHAKSTLITIKF